MTRCSGADTRKALAQPRAPPNRYQIRLMRLAQRAMLLLIQCCYFLLQLFQANAVPRQQASAIVLSLMGPPNGGKTSLSRHLTAAYGLVHLSSGALMRSEISRGTALGAKVQQRVESGGLVEDDLVLQLVETEVARLSISGTDGGRNGTFTGVILDGFPRTLAQARMLDEHNSSIPHIAAMIYVHMNESVLAERREGRRVCPKCGLTFNLNPIDHDGYHLKARVPKGDNETCDVDGARLERREDDQPAIAEKRMAAFHSLSLPMADYYDKQGKLISIEKTRGSGALFKIIHPTLEKLMHQQQLQGSRQKEQFRSTHTAAAHTVENEDLLLWQTSPYDKENSRAVSQEVMKSRNKPL